MVRLKENRNVPISGMLYHITAEIVWTDMFKIVHDELNKTCIEETVVMSGGAHL